MSEWLRTPPDFSSPPRDELVIKVLVALGLPGVDVHEVVQIHRRYLVELMQQWTRLKEDESRFDLNFALVVDAELFRLDSLIRWLDTADGRLKRAAADDTAPAPQPFPLPKARRKVGSKPSSYLELRDISKVYGEGAAEVHALRRIDLAVEAGSLVAVMGASGSGKSTLLTIAGSLEDPTSGEVYVGGRPCPRCRERQGAPAPPVHRLRVPGLQPAGRAQRAGERLPAPELDGVAARKAQAAALESLEDFGLADRASHYPDMLSGGERQRVAIARAVVGNRHLLLADEPSGALDSTNAESVMRLILAACHRGMAAVVVTHDAQLASWADRVIFLRDGRIVDQTLPVESPEAVLAHLPNQ